MYIIFIGRKNIVSLRKYIPLFPVQTSLPFANIAKCGFLFNQYCRQHTTNIFSKDLKYQGQGIEWCKNHRLTKQIGYYWVFVQFIKVQEHYFVPLILAVILSPARFISFKLSTYNRIRMTMIRKS